VVASFLSLLNFTNLGKKKGRKGGGGKGGGGAGDAGSPFCELALGPHGVKRGREGRETRKEKGRGNHARARRLPYCSSRRPVGQGAPKTKRGKKEERAFEEGGKGEPKAWEIELPT